MELIKRYNAAINKLDSLESEKVIWIFEELNENDKITLDDVKWMEDNANATKEIYKKSKWGVYSDQAAN
jgi:hypothetical protein